MSDPVVTGFIGRWTESTWPAYLAWLKPALTWGIFLFAMYGALLCMVPNPAFMPSLLQLRKAVSDGAFHL